MRRSAYLRDGRAPVPSDERTSALMSRIRARNTGPELLMRKALRASGLVGYRINYKGAEGRPDVAFVGRRVAVFVHGCFWHGCPHCSPVRPRTNAAFWNDKIDANQRRDKRKVAALRRAGWSVLTVWACRLQRDPAAQACRVARALASR